MNPIVLSIGESSVDLSNSTAERGATANMSPSKFPQSPTVSQNVLTDLATISFAAITSADPSLSDPEISRLLRICETHGFFYLKDHAVSISLVRRAVDASKHFFHLPRETKENFGQHMHPVQPSTCRGYVATENLNANGRDCKQLFDLGVPRPLVPGKRFSGPNILPEEDIAPDFAKSLLELQDDVMSRLVPGLYRAFGKALGLGAEFFAPYMKEPTLIQRVICYPPKLGVAGKHTDSGLFTILIQESNDNRSLQVYTGGQWVKVEAREDLFVVNLGDILQLWTCGRFVSTPHMVRHNSAEKERFVMPFFVYPDRDAVFLPLDNSGEAIKVGDVMDRNFKNIWVDKTGAGRARELV